MSRLATTAGGGAVGARCSHLLPSSEFPLLEEGEPPSGELTPRAVRNLPDPHALDTGALVGSPCSFVLLASDGMSGIRPAAPCSSPVPPHAGVDVAPNSLSSLLKTSLSSAPVLSAVPFILVGRAWRSCETPCGFESLHGLLPAKGCMPEARAGKAARSRSSSSARRRISAFACSSASVLSGRNKCYPGQRMRQNTTICTMFRHEPPAFVNPLNCSASAKHSQAASASLARLVAYT
eukprot:scaffold230581_cov32-Tisochrysis_lutea.AAC.2